MAGSITLALSQQFDNAGNLNAGGQVFFIQAGTVGTPQNAYQDLGLTNPWPNPYTLLSDGRIPQVYFADGYIKVRITDADTNQVFNQDNIPVVGPSSGGGGGGGGVDPTTVLQTGWLQAIYTTGNIAGFVRANGRTIGNAVSGATERANADTAPLFTFLYNVDPNLPVSGGRTNAAADYAAGKTITLPDLRGRAIAGLDDMGNSAAGRLTAAYFGVAGTTFGAAGGLEHSPGLLTANLPAYTPGGALTLSTTVSTSVTTTVTGTFAGNASIPVANLISVGGATDVNRLSLKNNANTDAGLYGLATVSGSITASGASSAISLATPIGSFTGSAQGGTSTPFAVASPMLLMTFYIKL